MRKIFDSLIAVALFFAFSVALNGYVAPFFTTKDLTASLGQPAESRAPVLVFVREGGRPIFVVTQLRYLDKVTGKYPGHSFLLPTGSSRIIDSDGDRATYTAEEIVPGRQLIQLHAMVGDYPYNVEYQAEEKRVFPIRADFEDMKQGAIFAMPISLILTWLAMRLISRRAVAGNQATGAVLKDGNGK